MPFAQHKCFHLKGGCQVWKRIKFMFRRNFVHSFTQARGLCGAVGMGWIPATPAPRAAPEPPSPALVTTCPAAGQANTHHAHAPRCTWHAWMQHCQRPFGYSTPAGTPGPPMSPTALQNPESLAGPMQPLHHQSRFCSKSAVGKELLEFQYRIPVTRVVGYWQRCNVLCFLGMGKSSSWNKQQAPHKNSLPYTYSLC